MQVKVEHFKELQYVIRYPDGYVEGKKYPVILFMHGAGSRGKDINSVITNPYFNLTEKHKKFPFITIAPQCSEDTWFDIFTLLKEFVCRFIASDFADSERIYAVGASMGGYAVWQLAMSMPEVFAAIVPVCGGGMYWNATRLVNVNVWAFHGEKDTVVYPEESVKMVESINKAGGNARITLYKDKSHDSWSETYSNYEVFDWLLKCVNNKTKMIKKNVMDDSKKYG